MSESSLALSLNFIHLTLFMIATTIFITVVVHKLKFVSKGRAIDTAPIEAKVRSYLLNVLFQYKLFKHPARGVAHALIFYGFLVYLYHTISQMIAGNFWYLLYSKGADPYRFNIPSLMTMLSAQDEEAGICMAAAFFVIFAGTLYLFNRSRIYHSADPNRNRIAQWSFLVLMILELKVLFLFLTQKDIYEFWLQIFSIAVLLSLIFFATRRWIKRAVGLDYSSFQSAAVILLIATLMISTLFMQSASKMIHQDEHQTMIDVFVLMVIALTGYADKEGALAIRNFSWWVHIGSVYVFMIYVPNSKHAHLIFAPINYLMIKKNKQGAMETIPLEDESALWGAETLRELSRKSLLDSLSCIECGRCTVECPAYLTGKPLDPKKLVNDVKHNIKNINDDVLLLSENGISEEEVWSCTSCAACVEACPVGNNQPDIIFDIRRNLVLAQSNFPPLLQNVFINMEKNSNPWGVGADTRADWCKGLDVKTLAENPDAEVLYWVGCAGSFDERNKKISRAFASVLNRAQINFAILGREEKCTGDQARRAGNEYLFQTLATSNIETLNGYGVKKIVTTCPHCFNTLKNEYPDFGGEYEVVHHSELLYDLIANKRVTVKNELNDALLNQKTVYHDSCYAGRYNDIYDAPRLLLTSCKASLVEACNTKERGFCCGAGGSQMWMEEKHERINIERTKQLMQTGASTIATACPFCNIMIGDGIKSEGEEEHVKVKDIAEITEELLM